MKELQLLQRKLNCSSPMIIQNNLLADLHSETMISDFANGKNRIVAHFQNNFYDLLIMFIC